VISAGTQGDGATTSANTEITLTFTGSTGPDPAACATLSDWFLAYEQVREPLLTCSITGTTGRLTVASPPASPNVQVGLTYVPTAQQLILTNSTVLDTTTGDDLQQLHWWCRRPGPASVPWTGKPDETCTVPSPGKIDLQVDLIYVGATTSPTQDYALFCDPTPLDAIDDAVRVGESFNQFGTMPIRYASQGISTLLVPHGTAISSALPAVAGVTDVAGGTMRRQATSVLIPVLGPNERVEYRFALEVDSGLATGTTYGCALRPSQSGAPLSLTMPAMLRIGPAQFFSQ
jgi:hypothetical protein